MADFWAGFGQGFAPAYESSFERARRSREKREDREYAEEQRKKEIERLAQKAKEDRIADVLGYEGAGVDVRGIPAVKGQLPGPWSRENMAEQPHGPLEEGVSRLERPTRGALEVLDRPELRGAAQAAKFRREDNLESEKKAHAAELLRNKQKFDASLLNSKRREASEAKQDVMRGQKWTDPRDGTLKIPENMMYVYPPGSQRHRDLVTASGDYSIALKKPKDDLWRMRAGDAQDLLSEIQVMSGSYIVPWDDMTRKQQDNWVSEHGFKELNDRYTALAGYVERFGEPPTYDVMLGEEKAKLEAEIAENQRIINEGSQPPAVLNVVKRETFKLRRRLSVLHAKTTRNVASLKRKNEAFDTAEKDNLDVKKFAWNAGRTDARKAVNDFNRLIKAQEFKNGKNERNILVGKPNEEGEQDTLWQRTYFRKVHLKDEDGKNTEQFYLDVKPEFKKWLTTYKQTIPQFVGGEEVIAMNPTGAEKSILYLPDQKQTPPKQPPEGRVEKPPPAEPRVGQPELEAFWVESPTISSGPSQHERDRVRLLHRIGPDGNIEAPVEPEPKLLEPKGDLKRVPRRGEPRADADEAANLFEDAKADAKAMTTLVEFFRQATAEEKAAMEAVRGDEEAQIAILRGIMQRVNKPVD